MLYIAGVLSGEGLIGLSLAGVVTAVRWWLVRLLPSGLRVLTAQGSVNFIGAMDLVGMF